MFHIKSKSDYEQQYKASLDDPQKFWSEISKNYFWFEEPEKIMDCDFDKGKIKWFEDGVTNISYNCLDRHLASFGDRIAIIWESNNPQEKNIKITYKDLHEKTCQFANLLVAQGVRQGDRVCIYMPMIIESVVAMLACARIGAVHCVVFAGFSAKALAGRINDCGAKILITSDLLFRGEKKIELFEIAKEAITECETIEKVILYERDNASPSAQTRFVTLARGLCNVETQHKHVGQVTNSQAAGGNIDYIIWQNELSKHSATHQASPLPSESPLFILYTSGSTGKPKGILHTTGGYMTYAGYTFKNVFQYRENEVFFCTADIGWITGHSYLAYGPLLNAGTILMFEGIPTYPTASRFWEIIDKHKVNIFYTAPTAIRSLMQKGDEFLEGHNLSSLRALGSVGEPINEEAWQWYFEKIGKKKCAITDTWWQTETGGIMISSLAGVLDSKPAHAGHPLPGISPILLDDDGNEIKEKNKVGNLCITQPWPGMLRGVWGDEKKFQSYFVKNAPAQTLSAQTGFVTPSGRLSNVTTKHKHAGGITNPARAIVNSSNTKHYLAGDGAFINSDGLYRIIGRNDDVIKVSGHRLGTAEIENAINSHKDVSESAVIGVHHEIKGEAIHAFVITRNSTKNIETEINKIIIKEIGSIAKPDKIYLTNDLPKTRSGKIMRRILKKIVNNEEDFGDTSTLLNPDIINEIKKIL